MSQSTERLWPFAVQQVAWCEVPYGRMAGMVVRPNEEAVLVIGAFDGLHLGHQALLQVAQMEARKRGLPCLAVTFDPDPADFLRRSGSAEEQSHLLSCDDRVAGLLHHGVDAVISLSFDEVMAVMAPQAFVAQVLCSIVKPSCVFVGENFRFGAGSSGDVALLSEIGKAQCFGVEKCALVSRDGEPISATRVRTLLGEGRLGEANELLDRWHYVRGRVQHGRGKGTGFGFPTANVWCDAGYCMPADGVYACYVVCDGSAWPAAANVGVPPTFESGPATLIEANLLGFEGDLYGREVSVVFVEWLRASRRFSSLEELEQVVLGNIDWVRSHLGDSRMEVSA